MNASISTSAQDQGDVSVVSVVILLSKTLIARRFWPVACGDIDLESLTRDRDQLWSEAVVHFMAGAPWWLETPKLEALAKAEQEARYEVDAWTEKVIQAVDWGDRRKIEFTIIMSSGDHDDHDGYHQLRRKHGR
jgi:putative DNA primase/helicase